MAGGREMFLATFENEMAVFHARVFQTPAGVILAFVIAHEALLVIPLVRVRQAVIIKFIRPDEFPIGGRGAGRQQQAGGDQFEDLHKQRLAITGC
jgi:hypothetical protein